MTGSGNGNMACLHREEGFTLMELLVVVAIVGILVIAFGASFFGWRERYKSEADVKTLYSAMIDAKVNALKEGRYFFVNIPDVSAGRQVVRIYMDKDPADPNSPGDGVLDTAVDEKYGPDIVLNNRLDLVRRHFWFNAQGHLMHDDYKETAKRAFQVRVMQWESTATAQSDANCLFVSPPLYIGGGIWNAEEGTANDVTPDMSLTLNASGKIVSPGLDYPLCTAK